MKHITILTLSLAVLTLLLAGSASANPGAPDGRIYTPFITGSKDDVLDCNIPNTSYNSLASTGDPQLSDPETNYNLNLGYMGFEPTDAELKLVTYSGTPDPKSPQFPAFFVDNRTPAFTGAYQRYRWDPACDCPKDTYSPYDVTVLGLGVQPGEIIYTPESGYVIGGGYEYQVTYAGESGITLYIGNDDDFNGYVIHVDGVCTEPDLLALFRQLHAAGRKELPVLRGHQPFGRALGSEFRVAVRDTGHFLDPRSRDDWWKGR